MMHNGLDSIVGGPRTVGLSNRGGAEVLCRKETRLIEQGILEWG